MHTITVNSTSHQELANLLQSNHSTILSRWRKQSLFQNVLNDKEISMDFFIKHFGSRVLDYFIGVLRGEKSAGQCPVIIVMLKFFSTHGLSLDEIFQICSAKRNAVIHTLHENGISHSDDTFGTAVALFDTNFSGVIREYIDINFGISSNSNQTTSDGIEFALKRI